jgi:EAL domain-containing protein (putative c-di-GMP-specific phosphodiesterase class I)
MTAERQYILLADDEECITEALSFTLEREGRTVIVCSDIDAAEVALARFPITHVVTDVQFSGEFGFEGLHSLGRIRTQSPDCRIILMTGHATDALRRNALLHGASAVLAKPFDTSDLEEALRGEAGIDEPWEASPYETIRIPSIDEILCGDALSVDFQPIVRLDAGYATTFAYEALTRVRGANWLTSGPEMLFEYAERRGKLAELNLLMMVRAVVDAAALPPDVSIFINIDPLTFSNPRLVPELYSAALRAGVALNRVVLEVTERSGFAHDTRGGLFDELRGVGVRFALDDHGSAYSHLSQIHRIRPSFIKISNTFGTAFELDETKERIVRHTLSLARDFGCETILEGIETSDTAVAAAAAGVRLAQGFYFSCARAASHWTESNAAMQAA